MIQDSDLRNQRRTLSGIAPLMGVPDFASQPAGGSSAEAAGTDAPSEETASDPAVEPAPTAPDRSASIVDRNASASDRIEDEEGRGDGRGWKKAAIGLASAGILLAVAPQIPGPVAGWLHAAGDLQYQAGPLFVAALLALCFARLQTRISGVRRSIATVRGDTARIEQIAASGHTLSASIDLVRHANATLTGDLNKLQAQMKKLTEIVSNPDYTVSIFRLAASVDQLGKHLHTQITDRFEGLQQRAVSLADQTGQVERQLATRLEQLGAAVKDNHRTQQVAVQEGFAQARAAAEQAIARLEEGLKSSARIEARIQKQHEVASTDLASRSDRQSKATHELGAALSEIRNRIDRQFEEHAAVLLAKLEGIDGRIDLSGREQSTNLQELGVQIEGRFSDQVDELRQRLRNQHEAAAAELAALSNRQAQGTHELSATLTEIRSRMDGRFEEHAAAVLAKLEGIDGRIDATEREHASGIQELGVKLEARWTDQVEAVQQRLRSLAELADGGRQEAASQLGILGTRVDDYARSQATLLSALREHAAENARQLKREIGTSLERLEAQLDQKGKEHVAAMRKNVQEAQQASVTAQRELLKGLERIDVQIEKQGREQQTALQKTSQEDQQTSASIRRELSTRIEEIAQGLEQEAQAHLAAIQRASQEALAGTSTLRHEIADGLSGLAARVEERLESECNDLAGDLVALSEMFTSTSIDLRSTVEKLLAERPRSAVEAVLPLLEEPKPTEAEPPTASLEPTAATTDAPATTPTTESVEPTPPPSPELATDTPPSIPTEPVSELTSPTAIEIALDAALDTTREIRPEAPPDSGLSEPTTIVWIPPPPAEQGDGSADRSHTDS